MVGEELNHRKPMESALLSNADTSNNGDFSPSVIDGNGYSKLEDFVQAIVGIRKP